ncbi:MAG: hypothetical protein KKE62_01910 [Proteobacteria bacterium]|nr:hypothetical protein [Pseudomonadota bacterium]MBU1387106.1 hypothetical protein [Pseudomonadota bacterium]MBU1541577.1 hypothetical protein [Pseudomonadota bacterium]MBU2429523.1 hypothetical protein [Pseudomonadota bacterium]MBU2482534.1 hypothetical protein [Pseudomonadota bacterium]
MMDPATVLAAPQAYKIIEMVLSLGAIGIILIFWYFDKQQIDKTLAQYREDMQEQRRMYENNVELVRLYQGFAGDLKDIIVMNTTVMTKLVDRIDKEVCK